MLINQPHTIVASDTTASASHDNISTIQEAPWVVSPPPEERPTPLADING